MVTLACIGYEARREEHTERCVFRYHYKEDHPVIVSYNFGDLPAFPMAITHKTENHCD